MTKSEALALLPTSVRYVKNGRGGRWWKAAKANGQVHGGWSRVPGNLLEEPGDFSAIQNLIEQDPEMTDPGAQKRDLRQLRDLLDHPSQHIWVTYEDGCMWWCTVHDGVTAIANGSTDTTGHFWLTCDRPWSNHSLGGRLLAITELPGIATRAAGFRGTVCEPQGAETILRIIRDEQAPAAAAAAQARNAYEHAVGHMIQQLTWQDFEQLIDLILARTAWIRRSILGGTQEGFDIEAENLAADEIAFVQIKGASSQAEMAEYIERFQTRRDRYARMIYAVHSPQGTLAPPAGVPVQIWTGRKLSKLVVRLGLGEWVESRLG